MSRSIKRLLLFILLSGFCGLSLKGMEPRNYKYNIVKRQENTPDDFDITAFFRVPIFDRERANCIAQSILKLSSGCALEASCQLRQNQQLTTEIQGYFMGRAISKTLAEKNKATNDRQILNDQSFFTSFIRALDDSVANQVRAVIDRLLVLGNDFFQILGYIIDDPYAAPVIVPVETSSVIVSEDLEEKPVTGKKRKKKKKKKKRSQNAQNITSARLSNNSLSAPPETCPLTEFAQLQITTPSASDHAESPQAARISRILKMQKKFLYDALDQLSALDASIDPELLAEQQSTGYRRLILLLSSYTRHLGTDGLAIAYNVPQTLQEQEELSSALLMHSLYASITSAISTMQQSQETNNMFLERFRRPSHITFPPARDVLVQAEQRIQHFIRRGLQWARYMLSLEQPFETVMQSAQEYYGVDQQDLSDVSIRNAAVADLREAFQIRMRELGNFVLVCESIRIIRRTSANQAGLGFIINLVETIIHQLTPDLDGLWLSTPWGLPSGSLGYERAQEQEEFRRILGRINNTYSEALDLQDAYSHEALHKKKTKKPQKNNTPSVEDSHEVSQGDEHHAKESVQEAQEEYEFDQQTGDARREVLEPAAPVVITMPEEDTTFAESLTQVTADLSSMGAPAYDLVLSVKNKAQRKKRAAHIENAPASNPVLSREEIEIQDSLRRIFRDCLHLKIHKSEIKRIIKLLGGSIKSPPGNRNTIYFNDQSVDHFEAWHRGDKRGYLTSYWVFRIAGAIASAALNNQLSARIIALLPEGWDSIDFGPRMRFAQKRTKPDKITKNKHK